MIFVTGATGHVGNVLVSELSKRGELVRALALPGEAIDHIKKPGVEIVRGDVRDKDLLIRYCKDVDTVFHLAAIISILPVNKKEIYEVNVGGVKNILEACKLNHVDRLVYTSSIHAFAEPEPGSEISESLPFNPTKTSGFYGKSKAEAALNVMAAIQSGLNAVIICPTGIIGPYDYKLSEMGNLVRLYLKDRLKMGVDGSFDFVDVRDIVEGEIKAAKELDKGEVLLLGGQTMTIRKFLELLHEISGKIKVQHFLPKTAASILSLFSSIHYMISKEKAALTPYAIHALTRNYKYSYDKAKNTIGYKPRNIKDSLRDYINWLKSENILSI
jgi:dihydroflavonol-4-reductase